MFSVCCCWCLLSFFSQRKATGRSGNSCSSVNQLRKEGKAEWVKSSGLWSEMAGGQTFNHMEVSLPKTQRITIIATIITDVAQDGQTESRHLTMVISGKKPNFGRQDTRDTKTRHIHVTETMRHSTPSAPSTTLRPRWSLNSEHSVFNTLYISWRQTCTRRQNWNFGDKTQLILEKKNNSFGDNFSRNLWDFYFVGEKSFLVTISRGQNELPRVGETTQEVSTGQFAWMAHSFVLSTPQPTIITVLV